MRTSLVCAAFAVVVLPAGAGAQTVTLTESDALSRLSGQNPRVQAARAAVDLARADVLAAARWPNPRVTVSREAVSGIAEDMVIVSQALPITGRRPLDVRAAMTRVEASRLRADAVVRRMRADLRLAFTHLWAAQERERELARSSDRLSEMAQMLARREEAGDAAGYDRLRAEREVLDVDALRALAGEERRRAQAMLAGFLPELRDIPNLQAMPPSRTPAPLPSLDELSARAEIARGDLAAIARDVEAAALAEQAAARRRFPEPEVSAGTKTSNAAGGDVGTVISVHVALPLFDAGRPERAMAEARARQARADAAALRQIVHAQIAAWRTAVLERRGIAERHRAAAAAASDQIERIAQVSYEAGERGILDLLDAHRTASAARLRQIELDAAVREAEIELEFVSGWEIP